MAVVAAVTSGVTIGKTIADKLGINLPKINLGGLFGGGRKENTSSESLIDVIDNFDNISTAQARYVADDVVIAISEGANEQRVAQIIAAAGNYSVEEITTGYKWPQVRQWIQITKQELANQNQTTNSPVYTAAQAGSNTWKTYAIWGAGIIGAIGLGTVLIRRL